MIVSKVALFQPSAFSSLYPPDPGRPGSPRGLGISFLLPSMSSSSESDNKESGFPSVGILLFYHVQEYGSLCRRSGSALVYILMVDQIPKTVMWARCSDSQTTSTQEVVYQKCDSWNIVMVLEFQDGLDDASSFASQILFLV